MIITVYGHYWSSAKNILYYFTIKTIYILTTCSESSQTTIQYRYETQRDELVCISVNWYTFLLV